ncbi:unnamed protein product (macronuclear) [Paramecium tetraurelia]|uniref:Tetraspanin n=1 Tax=Paramecium tetraurelia TaxID=5888 RepID=A0BI34_PARTE|nr:uncharacterized protein GSPATT00029237001 [Paramecium tetraurelia]CAK58201.1 unnamed protein product [Paramecium tetraurelia]|eukprot:XP_001425599.1 hypothetical protein (macronuclear) [Paramecium tetraurelia strain d4-2]
MCLPYGCLKCFVQLEGWLTFVIGILAIVAAIIVTVIQKSFDDAIKDLGITDINTSAIIVPFWIFAAVVIFFAISGLCGAKHRSKCLLAIFNLGNICLFLAFLSLSIVAYVIGSFFDVSNCSNSSNELQIENLYKMSESTLCKSSCECYYSEKMTKEVELAVKSYSATDKTKPTRVQDCPGFDSKYKTQAAALQLMEEKWQCSGWCTPYPIQQFNDVNSNVKNHNYPCYKGMIEYFQNMFTTTGSILFSLAALFGVMVILTCCLCCHPHNSNKGSDYYTRLAYTADS